jgi:hypothetical protein
VKFGSELSSYLDSDTETQFGSDFNILTWWKSHNQTYPILSIITKDVLTVPASTISSESTFSLAGRVLEERRRRLTTDMVEVLSCIKDWELADLHKQHEVEKETKELVGTMLRLRRSCRKKQLQLKLLVRDAEGIIHEASVLQHIRR